MCTFMLQDLTG
jgi:ketosteroid isomerase-like protein